MDYRHYDNTLYIYDTIRHSIKHERKREEKRKGEMKGERKAAGNETEGGRKEREREGNIF